VSEVDALSIGQSAIWAVIMASGPAVLTAMVIGTTIALLQALTQVQEVTLTFIPKIVAILVVCAVTAPYMGSVILSFTQGVYGRIETGF